MPAKRQGKRGLSNVSVARRREIARLGGLARAASLSAARRKEIAAQAGQAASQNRKSSNQ